MAYSGYGVWALVAANMISSAIPAIVFWFFVKWRPIWIFSKKSFKELFSFGFYMFLTHLVSSISSRIQGLLIGKIYSPVTMGYYSKAMSTESLASSSITSIMTQVTYPLYAEAQHDKKQLGNMIKRITMTISYITFPLLFILLLTAKPIFLLLYSERWLASVPYFQFLCLAGMGACLTAVNTQSIAAIGLSKIMFTWTMFKRVIGLIAVVGGLFLFGMKGLLIGVIFNNWFSYLVNILLVSKYIGYKWTTQLRDLAPVGIVSFAAAAISYLCVVFLPLGLYLKAIIEIIVYLIVYMGWSIVIKPESFVYTLSVLPDRFRFWEKMGKK